VIAIAVYSFLSSLRFTNPLENKEKNSKYIPLFFL